MEAGLVNTLQSVIAKASWAAQVIASLPGRVLLISGFDINETSNLTIMELGSGVMRLQLLSHLLKMAAAESGEQAWHIQHILSIQPGI